MKIRRPFRLCGVNYGAGARLAGMELAACLGPGKAKFTVCWLPPPPVEKEELAVRLLPGSAARTS